jgi:hypothetical protein
MGCGFSKSKKKLKSNKALLKDISFYEWGFILEFLKVREMKILLFVNTSLKTIIEENPTYQSCLQCLHSFNIQHNHLFLLSVPNLRQNYILFTHFTFPSNFDSIFVNGRIFLSGGKKQANTYLFSHYQIELEGRITKKKQMLSSKIFHLLIHLKPNFLYSIGGKNAESTLNTTEKYNIKKNTWRKLANLQEAKMRVSGCILSEHLYIFGGYREKEGILNTIERLNCLNEKKGWELIVNGRNMYFSSATCIEIANDEIMIFGGWRNSALSNNCFLYSQNTQQFTFLNDIPRPDSFWTFKPMLVNDTLWVLSGSLYNVLYSFYIPNSQWSCIRF